MNAAFVTSGLFYMAQRSSEVKGQIFLYSFVQPHGEYKAKPVEIENDFDRENFHPHGLSSFIVDGQILLYVINHDNSFKHSVEVFAYDEQKSTLKHLRSIKDDSFIRSCNEINKPRDVFRLRPNNLVVVGKDKFILTNDGSGQSWFWAMLEGVFSLNSGSIIFYDGELQPSHHSCMLNQFKFQTSHTLIKSSLSPNGIGIDRTKSHIIVASPLGKTITVYKISNDYKTVELISTVDLHTSPDNVYVADNNDVWTGAHPIAKQLFAHNSAPDDLKYSSPSQVLRIAFSRDFKTWTISEPYMNDGTELVASTIAVPYYQQLLIGTIYRTLLHCDIIHSAAL
ncbi:unnamed protein product [Anisakis simplex]|uniref:Uncharacterized protein n=1 Tax=Anisakis simplex TaxID=6269 RepID=A0A3P6RJH9_ANISI|nr:unnamed protein product [Anisakis simplex]